MPPSHMVIVPLKKKIIVYVSSLINILLFTIFSSIEEKDLHSINHKPHLPFNFLFMGGTIMNTPDMMLIYYCCSYYGFMTDLTIFSYLHLYDTFVLLSPK